MKFYLSILLMGLVSLSWCQDNLLQGKFVGEGNKPISEVYIQFTEDLNSTFSDDKGFFRLSIPRSFTATASIKISHPLYESVEIPIVFSSSAFLDLGEWKLTPKGAEVENSLLDDHIDPTSFFDDNNQQLNIHLQSRRTPFLSAVSFQFSASFFSIRGLRRNHLPLRFNGVLMNDMENNTAPWSQWGGLNDVLNRSQLVQHGLSPYGEYFGGLLGAVEINVRPSSFRKGIKIGQAFSNQSYQSRSMLTLNSGKLNDGWSFSGLVSVRKGDQGYVSGTHYQGYSFLAASEKQWNVNQNSRLTLWFTPSERGRNAPITEEVYALKGKRYNPYWGYDGGRPRNSRVVRVAIPHIVFNHTINFSNQWSFNLGAAYQFGEQGNSRLLYTGQRPLGETFIGGGRNPDPVYYQKLPSYFLRNPDQVNYRAAYDAQEALKLDGQIDWESMRSANYFAGEGASRYALYEDVRKHQSKTLTAQLIA